MHKEEYLRIIGNRIRNRREELKISRLELAMSIDVDESSIKRIENGEINTSILTFNKLLIELRLNPSEIFLMQIDKK